MTSTDPDDHPHVIALPPAMEAMALIVGAALEWVRPLPLPLPGGWRYAGVVLVLVAVALAVWARRVQATAGTNVNPRKPTTAIVTAGPYGFTRNPMYVGLSVLHLGIAVWARSGWLLVTLLLFAALLHWGVVLREERYLDAKFGPPYRDYKARVRRYL